MMFLLYGPSSVTMLPIYPANERRDSDQYAESRENLSADGGHCKTSVTVGDGHCRTSGTVGDGFNGS